MVGRIKKEEEKKKNTSQWMRGGGRREQTSQRWTNRVSSPANHQSHRVDRALPEGRVGTRAHKPRSRGGYLNPGRNQHCARTALDAGFERKRPASAAARTPSRKATDLLCGVAKLRVEDGENHGSRQVHVRLEKRDHLRAAAWCRHHKHILQFRPSARQELGHEDMRVNVGGTTEGWKERDETCAV